MVNLFTEVAQPIMDAATQAPVEALAPVVVILIVIFVLVPTDAH